MSSSITSYLRLLLVHIVLIGVILTGGGWDQLLPATLAQSGGTAASENQAANNPGSLDPQENGLSEGRSTFWWLIETSGWIGLALLIISLYFVAKVTQCFLELRESVLMPPKFVARCHQLIAEREFTTLLATAKAENSEIGRVLTTAFSGLSIGIAEAREAVDRGADTLAVNLETKISMLAVIGSLGPMIGLLGTLKGMISSFSVIALSDQQMKASAVAGGISEALILTFEGVALSVPAIYFFAFFRNRVANLTVAVQNTADEIVKRVYLAAKNN